MGFNSGFKGLITVRPPEGARSSVEQSIPQEALSCPRCQNRIAADTTDSSSQVFTNSIQGLLIAVVCDACQCGLVFSVQNVVDYCTQCCLITCSKDSGQSSNIRIRIGDRYFENLSVVKCSKEQEQTKVVFMMKTGSRSNSEYIPCCYDENLSLGFLARNTNIKTRLQLYLSCTCFGFPCSSKSTFYCR